MPTMFEAERNAPTTHVGAMLRAARGQHSQREMAAALRISPSLLCRLEKGERRLTLSIARAVDAYLGATA